MNNISLLRKTLTLACAGLLATAVIGCSDKKPDHTSPNFDDGSPQLPVTSSNKSAMSSKDGSKA